MTVCCFTSFTFSYLAKAAVLAASVKRYHPDWVMCAVITDREPSGYTFDPETVPFDEIVWGDELFGAATPAWLFKHDLVEACTAVKGRALRQLLEQYDKVIYLDPDVAVFAPMTSIVEGLDRYSTLLTPHQLDPAITESSIRDNEFGSLKHGTFNLGFLAVRSDAEGDRFAEWWEDRLTRFCFSDPVSGLFVDQKWCDLAPAFFSELGIVRDPGYNVASWNLNRRRVTIDVDGAIKVNGEPLKFYHFTKLGEVGDTATMRYAGDSFEVFEIWAWYKRAVASWTDTRIPNRWWHYAQYDNGERIPQYARELYRNRPDLQRHFPHPFSAAGESYYAWLQAQGLTSGAAG